MKTFAAVESRSTASPATMHTPASTHSAAPIAPVRIGPRLVDASVSSFVIGGSQAEQHKDAGSPDTRRYRGDRGRGDAKRLRAARHTTVLADASTNAGLSRDDAVDLEDLGVVPVDVGPVNAGEIPDVLLVGVAAVLLGGVAAHRCDLALDVRSFERQVRAVREVEVVPGDLVAEDRRALERAEPLLGDRLVVLVDVVVRRLEDDVGAPLVPERDEQLEDLLPPG